MIIKWYGHSAFKITTEKGSRIIIDPYEPGGFNGALTYGQIGDIADIIVTSHDHADHNFVRGIPGDYTLIDKAGEYPLSDGEKIETIPVYHDDSKGSERGNNLITVISSESLVLAHLGDLGHRLDPGIISKIGKLDILLLPVGGFFTIDAVTAIEVKNVLGPSVTIPMHYKTEKCGFPIAPVDAFTRGQRNVRVLDACEKEFKRVTLPKDPEIIVLKYAL